MAAELLFETIPDTWELTSLGEACKNTGGNIQTGPFGSQLHAADYVPHGIPSIMPQNIGDNRVIENGIARITPEDAKRLTRYLVRSGDIIYSRRGDVERRALIREHENGWLCGTGCLRIRFGDNNVDPLFASFYLGHPVVREWIVRHAHGATMPNLNTSILSEVPFVIPPHKEQQAISHILGTLDDKIELNRKMNQTLEAMARAIFKSWFVDFDPVRAKAEGRDSGLPPDLATLFPDSFEDSELGEIPKGWRILPVGEALNAVGGSTPSTANPAFWDAGEFHWATPKDLSGLSSPILIGTERKITKAGVEQISSGLLPVGTVLMSSRAPVGYLALSAIPVAVNQGFIAMICDGSVSNYYALNWCHYNMEEIQQRASGTTFAEISKAAFRPIPMIVPEDAIMKRFTEIVEPLYKSISERLKETRTLAALRDALLPKLLSGELRVDSTNSIERPAV